MAEHRYPQFNLYKPCPWRHEVSPSSTQVARFRLFFNNKSEHVEARSLSDKITVEVALLFAKVNAVESLPSVVLMWQPVIESMSGMGTLVLPRLVDHLVKTGCPLFKVSRADVADISMSTFSIVKTLNVVKHICTCFVPR